MDNSDNGELKKLSEAELLNWLRPVQDPELYLSIVELGLVYECKHEENRANIKMTLTSPGCPAGPLIIKSMEERLLEHEAIKEAKVEIVWEPKWDPTTMASEECRDHLGIW